MSELWVLLLGVIVLVVFLILAGLVVFYLVAQGTRTPPSPDEPPIVEESSHDLARRRYARGEITREEYLSLRRDLED